MTSQTININSDYFQVTPEGKVTCQALSVTGEKSFINLNDIFIVTPDGKVTIVDDGNPYNGRNFTVSKDSGDSEYASMTYNALTFYDGNDYTDFKAGAINLSRTNTTLSIADFFSMQNVNGGTFQISPVSNKYNVYVEGSVYADNISSDINLKKNIKESKINALDRVKKIEHKSFDWKANDKHEENGYIAQDLEKIDNNLVEKVAINGEEKYYLNLKNLVALSTKAIQELAEEVEELKNGKAN